LRYVLDANEKTLPSGNAGYIFTDANGNIIPDTSMQYDVDITGLNQYIYIDYRDPNLPNLGSTGLKMS